MKKVLARIIILSVGIGVGLYISSKIDEVIGLSGVVYEELDYDDTASSIINNAFKSDYTNELVLVESVYDDFQIDLRYATKNNITGSELYELDVCYLQKNTLEKLIQVNEDLKSKGYKLKIWDGYRPLAVQKKLWATLPNANYIANPFGKGSNHNRGAAVDVTLVTLDGKEVDMPTDFDGFGPECHRDYKWTDKQTKNVKLLTETMLKYGFDSIETEWWHFDDIDSYRYPIMDYKLRELIKK